ncbi:MAG: C40 family peptidase [Acidimicrobiales bacterium]
MGQGRRRVAGWAAGLACLAVAGVWAAPVNATPVGAHGTGQEQSNFWLATPSGSLYAFGATDYGSPAGPLNQPIVSVVPSSDQQGYWLVASDGGVFNYGDTRFFGSTGNIRLNRPIVGLAPTPTQQGYWLVASDGGVFTFGDAAFYGSAANDPGDPVQEVVPTRSGHGYWIVQQNGTESALGDAGGTAPTTAVLLAPTTPGDRAVLYAFQQLGKPYIWGGNGPVGYDCSGLVLASWSHADGVTFARVADDQYHTAGAPVALTGLRAGDLIFWGYSQTDWTTVYHTAMYVGGNRIVEATGDHVQLNSLNQWGTGDLMPIGRRP